MTTFNVAPVVAPARSARRDGTMQPPAVLLPFFEVLATYDGPIPLSDLHATWSARSRSRATISAMRFR